MASETLRHLIPHAGSMCLIDEILSWDATRLACRTRSHRAMDNPLRRAGMLHGIHAVEYAGQASALHSGLLTPTDRDERIRGGLLVGVKDAEWRIERLDTLPETLEIEVERLFADARNAIYRYCLSSGDRPVASGRLTVMADRETAA